MLLSLSGTIEYINNNRVGANTYTLNEDEKWPNNAAELSSSINLRLKAPTDTGIYRITAVDVTETNLQDDNGDYPNDHRISTFESFIFYVWQTEALSRNAMLTPLSTPQIVSDEEPKTNNTLP